MRIPPRRLFHAMFGLGWLAGLGLALAIASSAGDLKARELLGLALAGYLATWGLVFFRSDARRVIQAARFLLCSTSILLVVGMLEATAMLGLIDYRTVFQTPTAAWERPQNRPDPELLYVRGGPQQVRRVMTGNDIARLHGARSWKIYRCDVRLDRDGFRNPEGMASAEVIAVGDSFVEGLHVDDTELFTARLGQSLGTSVANFGRSGDGPQQELEVLRRYGLALRPRTCIWTFYEGNDLADAGKYEASRDQVRRHSRQTLVQAAVARSFTLNFLDNVIRTRLSRAPRPPARLYSGDFTDRAGRKVDFFFASDDQFDETHAVPGPRGKSPELELARASLAEAHALCASRGIELVVVFIPTKLRVYRDLCTFAPESPCPTWPIDDLPEALGAKLREISADIRFIDLTPRLRAAASAGELVYLPDDTHWTAEGHRVSAEVLSETLGTAEGRPRSRHAGVVASQGEGAPTRR